MKISAIDIGSYSVRLTVAEREGKDVRILLEKGRITSLGSGVKESGLLREDRIEETLRVLEEYRRDIRELGVKKVVCVATEALRRAGNAEEFIDRVRDKTGIHVRLISPEEEGELSFLGACYSLRCLGSVLVVDQGGGSTEFVFGSGLKVDEIFSLPVGIVSLTEAFLKHDPPTEEEVRDLFAFLREHISAVEGDPEYVIGLGGTITTLAALEMGVYPYDPTKVQGVRLSLETVSAWFDKLSSLSSRERSERFPQIEDRRAEVIPSGVAMFVVVLERFRKRELTVSDWGLKHGLIIKELFTPEELCAII